MKYDVFISYARKDYVTEEGIVIPGNIVSQIKDILTKNKISFWFDEEGVYSGDEFAKVIVQNIKKANVFLFISTRNSNASEWTSREIATANHYKKKILPFRYDDTPYNDAVMLHIADLDYIYYQKNPQKAFSKLVLSIKENLERVQENFQSEQTELSHKSSEDVISIKQGEGTGAETHAPTFENANVDKQKVEKVIKKASIINILKLGKIYIIPVGLLMLIGVVFLFLKLINFQFSDSSKFPYAYSHDLRAYDVTWFGVKGTQFPMIKIQAGTFMMGGDDADAICHEVTLTKNYYIGQTEVTQELWNTVMESNPSNFKGNNLPVDNVSWEDCIGFISRLNSLTGKKFRLPTEAEWEYAAVGGSDTGFILDSVVETKLVYSGSDTLSNVGWYKEVSNEGTQVVSTKKPNKLGIFDMSGNLWEWCQDIYGPYEVENSINPTGVLTGEKRVRRGGSWRDNSNCCRVTFRSRFKPDERREWHGFRLALSCEEN